MFELGAELQGRNGLSKQDAAGWSYFVFFIFNLSL